MKKFLISIACFLVLLAVCFGALLLLPLSPTNYLYAYLPKKQMLKDVKQPRVILIGGSNLAFGVNSKILADSLNVNVINTGLHASIGLRYMLDDADPFLREGDVVVVAPEYSQFYGAMDGTNSSLSMVVSLGAPESLKRLTAKQWHRVIADYPDLVKQRLLYVIIKSGSPDYDCNAFNEYGDQSAHWQRTPPSRPIASLRKETFEPEAVAYLGKKVKDWRERGVRVMIAPPVCMESNYQPSQGEAIERAFAECGLAYSARPESHLMPDSLAYDTPYHMSYPAVERFSLLLVDELRELGVGK